MVPTGTSGTVLSHGIRKEEKKEYLKQRSDA